MVRCGGVVTGCYGGDTGAGAVRNEDGALVWCAADGSWEFAVLLDAHASGESAGLVLQAVEAEEGTITGALAEPIERAFLTLQTCLLRRFRSAAFRAQCRSVRGETACLICARKAQFLWWLSIGDCVVYLFHPDLARFGQFALNQRSFFEWIGQANTFDLPAPCYATGVRELRRGVNRVLMTTDGLLECGTRLFEDGRRLYDFFNAGVAGSKTALEAGIEAALSHVRTVHGRDSATVIAWNCSVAQSGQQASV
jgi:serine/threonine protein phosphatase PrpC